MKKIISIISITWQKAITYRFTIFSYRIGEVIEMVFLITMWSALYNGRYLINGYTLQEMITYIVVGNLVALLTRNFMADVVARDIKDGTLSTFLIKPMSYFTYAFIRELGRVMLPFLISFSTQLIVLAFFWNKIIWNIRPLVLVLTTVIVILAFINELCFSYFIGLIAFWTDEVVGLYTTIDRLRKFLSGGYFPLSLLPPIYLKISFALPFAYSFFVPTQLYLGKISITQAFYGIGIQFVWILALCCSIVIVWRRGIKKYEGVGI